MCGIIGIWSDRKIPIVHMLHDSMLMQNHRGQEGSGICLFDGSSPLSDHRYVRLTGKETDSSVRHLFSKLDLSDELFLRAIGHNRYSTAGSVEKLENLQPFYIRTKFGGLALAHNGTIVNADELRRELEADGESFTSDSDTEVILKLIARSKREDLVSAIMESLEKVRGAFSVVILTRDHLIGARDPWGIRPLVLGEFDNGFMLASESCAFDAIESQYHAHYQREVEPGEVVVVDQSGCQSYFLPTKAAPANCIFELIYFARPDSIVFGRSVAEFRIELGRRHGKEFHHQWKEADFIVAVPDSANYFGDGLADELGIPHLRALVRNHYVGRTFIAPDTDPNQPKRGRNIRTKLNPIRSFFRGKQCIVCEDTIVRGNTSRKVCRMIKGCQPDFLGFAVSAPPILSHCPYGIDIKSGRELIAVSRTVDQIAQRIDADRLVYSPLEILKEVGGDRCCYGCFTKEYPLV